VAWSAGEARSINLAVRLFASGGKVAITESEPR
jgi:hypothetical protein